eukprot:11808705-Alexandrium_andersonii.AAC.1
MRTTPRSPLWLEARGALGSFDSEAMSGSMQFKLRTLDAILQLSGLSRSNSNGLRGLRIGGLRNGACELAMS